MLLNVKNIVNYAAYVGSPAYGWHPQTERHCNGFVDYRVHFVDYGPFV
ncbi:hypothetical protein GCM10007939_07980 [Amylibacter marinus]|uniref:Uncharacterized protein n=1 Tax=Amylibacter marinus TaxID=1475483 RepID=A0ABQ5VT45_9RHOB|nr:hypothetical protein GCM10007939_07980 [Amylibacter marinus]